MDLLIDLIIYAVKQMTKDRSPRLTPASFQEIQQQKAATEQRIREMQAAVAKQQSRTKPARTNRGPARGAAAAKAPTVAPSLTQVPDRWTKTAPATDVPTVVRRAPGRAPLPALRIPIILGEILAPPLALRDSEF